GWIPDGSLLNTLSATVMGPNGAISLPDPGLLALPAFKKTGLTINDPPSGSWTVSVTNNGLLFGPPQQLVIAIEFLRASYSVSGLIQLSPSDRASVKRALRTGLLTTTPSGDFAGSPLATRLDVAQAVMLSAGARVPQYLADSPSFTDEPNDASAIFIESVTHSPFGDLLGSVGGRFYPQSAVSRATAAVAIIKALGLESDAQTASSANPGLADWNQIPIAARGYVSLAVSRNLMQATAGMFRPNDSITRLELAVSGAALQQAAREVGLKPQPVWKHKG